MIVKTTGHGLLRGCAWAPTAVATAATAVCGGLAIPSPTAAATIPPPAAAARRRLLLIEAAGRGIVDRGVLVCPPLHIHVCVLAGEGGRKGSVCTLWVKCGVIKKDETGD